MIKKETDIGVLSGVSTPLLPLVYSEFCENSSSLNGLYVQKNQEEITSVFSLKNSCATFCFIDNCDTEELLSFFSFLGVTTVTREDNRSISFNFKSKEIYPLLMCKSTNTFSENVHFLNNSSTLKEYKEIYNLLSSDGDNFEEWYSDFSKKINSHISKCSFISCGNQITSCAIASGIYGGNAVISGVATKENYKNKGYATKCVKAILNNKNTYLWCKNELVDFYTGIGFVKVSNIIVGELD